MNKLFKTCILVICIMFTSIYFISCSTSSSRGQLSESALTEDQYYEYVYQIQGYIDEARYEKALITVGNVITNYPEKGSVTRLSAFYHLKSRIYFEQGLYEEAITSITKAIGLRYGEANTGKMHGQLKYDGRLQI